MNLLSVDEILNGPQLEQDDYAPPGLNLNLLWAWRNLGGWTRIKPGQANCSVCFRNLTTRTACWWLRPPDEQGDGFGMCDDHALSIVLQVRRGMRGTPRMTVPRTRNRA